MFAKQIRCRPNGRPQAKPYSELQRYRTETEGVRAENVLKTKIKRRNSKDIVSIPFPVGTIRAEDMLGASREFGAERSYVGGAT